MSKIHGLQFLLCLHQTKETSETMVGCMFKLLKAGSYDI